MLPVMKDRDRLRELLEAEHVGQHLRALLDASCSAVRLDLRPSKHPQVGTSRLGGLPDLPRGVAWPTYKDGRPLDFVAQIKLDEVARHDESHSLPNKGWLWFFVLGMYDDNRKKEPDYLSVCQVLFFEGDAKALEPRALPPSYERWWQGRKVTHPFKPCDIRFEPMLTLQTITVPPKDKPALNRVLVEYESPSDPRGGGSPAAEHRLLGHGRPPLTDVLLFHCNGHREAEMSWGDAGRLDFWIPQAALAKRAFGETRSEYVGET